MGIIRMCSGIVAIGNVTTTTEHFRDCLTLGKVLWEASGVRSWSLGTSVPSQKLNATANQPVTFQIRKPELQEKSQLNIWFHYLLRIFFHGTDWSWGLERLSHLPPISSCLHHCLAQVTNQPKIMDKLWLNLSAGKSNTTKETTSLRKATTTKMHKPHEIFPMYMSTLTEKQQNFGDFLNHHSATQTWF